jgi:hypothetical protein
LLNSTAPKHDPSLSRLGNFYTSRVRARQRDADLLDLDTGRLTMRGSRGDDEWSSAPYRARALDTPGGSRQQSRIVGIRSSPSHPPSPKPGTCGRDVGRYGRPPSAKFR